MIGGPVLAADLGGTKITAALVLPDHQRVEARTVPTPADRGGPAVLAALLSLLRTVHDASGRHGSPVGIGVGSAGVVDPTSGSITSATEAIPGFAGTPLGEQVHRAFGLPVRVLNDVHAHALGEAVDGAGRSTTSMVFVAVGTGIGGAFVLDGQVLTGAHDIAGHFGHLTVPEAAGIGCPCGRIGHLEGLASGPGTLAAFHRAGGQAADGRALVALAADGDQRARDVLTTCAFAIGRVIGGLLNALDPEVVVIGGGMASAGPLWWESVRRGAHHDAMDPVAATPLVLAAAGNDAALIGAAHAVRTTASTPSPPGSEPGRAS